MVDPFAYNLDGGKLKHLEVVLDGREHVSVGGHDVLERMLHGNEWAMSSEPRDELENLHHQIPLCDITM